jgi:hypothetical protein
MCITFNIMTCIQVAVYAVKIRSLLLLGIVQMSILSFLGELCREKILMAFYAADLRAFSSLPFSSQSNDAESLV